MRHWMVGVWGAALLSQVGCYDTHDLDEGEVPFLYDAGPVPDGALPPEAEPHPDEPPAPPIDVPPPIGSDDRALVPVGDPVALDDDSDGGGPPLLAWNGMGWGVAWGFAGEVRFRVLDASGRPVGVATTWRFGTRREWFDGAGLDFAGGRYALVTGPGRAASFDRDTVQVAGWSSAGSGEASDVARLSIDHRWVVAQTDADTDGRVVRAYALEDDMTTMGAPIELGGDGVGDVRIAGARTHALAVWMTPTRVIGRILRGRPFELVGGTLDILRSSGSSGSAVEPFGDRFVVAALQGREVLARFVHPFAATPIDSEAVVVGTYGTDRPAIATAPERGLVALCWVTGALDSEGDDGVRLQAIGTDGSRWGAPLQLASGERNIGGVSCGWNGSEIVVVWWRAGGDGAYNTVFSQRVRPTFL